MYVISRKYTLLLTAALLLCMLIPGLGIPHHVSLGRWTVDNCFLGEMFEILLENDRYAISIKGNKVKQVLRPVIAKSVEADGTRVFEDTINTNNLVYKIDKNNQMSVYQDGERVCICRHEKVKQGSTLDKH